jgi:hypothetical protein
MRGIVFAALLLALPATAGAVDEAALREAVKQSTDPAANVQTRLPGENADAAGRDRPASWRKREVGGDTPRVPARRLQYAEDERGGRFSTVANALMWVLVAIGAGLLIVWAVRELTGEGGRDAALPEPEAPSPEDNRAVVDQPLNDADELAGAGRFAEAIHTLLLRTLRELAARSRAAMPRSLTSREVLARVELGSEARAALGDLVTAVELTHFGDDEPGPADYDRCREQFHVFAAAWKAAA